MAGDHRTAVRIANDDCGTRPNVDQAQGRRRQAIVRNRVSTTAVIGYLDAVLAVDRAACSITCATSLACVMKTTWLALISVVFAPIRFA